MGHEASKVFYAALLLFVAALVGYHFNSQVSATIPYNNTRVSLDSSGSQVNNGSAEQSFSKNGRYIAFDSGASNLVSGDTNGLSDTFVKDLQTGAVTRVDVTSAGSQAVDGSSGIPKISADGRYVLFASYSPDLTGDTSPDYVNLLMHDMQTGTTTVVSTPNGGGLATGNAGSGGYDMSANGRYVVFDDDASNLVSGDTNGQGDVFVRDMQSGINTLISKSDTGTLGNGGSSRPSISCDGSEVAFRSNASNLVSGDTNSQADTFLVNRVGGDSISDITISGNGSTESGQTAISCDGSTVLFDSNASNLVSGDTNGEFDLFTYDVNTGAFDIVDQSTSGSLSNTNSLPDGYGLSTDGRFVVFDSSATNLVSGDTNGVDDIFLRDRTDGTTDRVSMRDSSTQTTAQSFYPAITQDGSTIAYGSSDSGLVSGDTNGAADIFTADSGTSICSQ